jgi:N-acetylglucosamine-6-sulfatase
MYGVHRGWLSLAWLIGKKVRAIHPRFIAICFDAWGDPKEQTIRKGTGEMTEAQAQQGTTKPNIVFILTDDMRKDDMMFMPKTHSLLGERNAFISNAICCPSRATIMRGQYSHNTGVWSNSSTDSSSTTSGGWRAYQDNGNEADNVATRLHDAGYRTALFGKYLNGYTDTTFVPRGWDRWFATLASGDPHYFDYNVNDDGTIRHFGTKDSDYSTDVISRKTNAFISYNAARGRPFFAYVAPIAPHAPSTPAPRDIHTNDGVKAPRAPSFDEKDVSDKPSWIRQLPRLTSDRIAEIDDRHEKRVESLQAVDDLVEGIVRELENSGVMNNTYIFFTSDNGFHHGEHRIPRQKWRPYEEDIHMPLLVRGPGVAAGSTTYKLVLNTDYLPTFTHLAGVQRPPYVDGRSLRPVLNGSVTSWRSAVLLEAAANYSPAYRGIRTISTGGIPKRKYVEYAGGARELYHLDPDPHELANSYDPAAPPKALAMRLQALKSCAAGTCRTAEDGP